MTQHASLYSCGCGASFTDQDHLTDHVAEYRSRRARTLVELQVCALHEEEDTQTARRSLTCPVSNCRPYEPFSARYLLRRHFRTHKSINEKCPICHMDLLSVANYYSHYRYHLQKTSPEPQQILVVKLECMKKMSDTLNELSDNELRRVEKGRESRRGSRQEAEPEEPASAKRRKVIHELSIESSGQLVDQRITTKTTPSDAAASGNCQQVDRDSSQLVFTDCLVPSNEEATMTHWTSNVESINAASLYGTESRDGLAQSLNTGHGPSSASETAQQADIHTQIAWLEHDSGALMYWMNYPPLPQTQNLA